MTKSNRRAPRPHDPNAVLVSTLAKCLGHPLRVEILHTIKHEGLASATSLANTLGTNVKDVAYHMKVLREPPCDVLELAGEQKVRGADERFYRLNGDHVLGEVQWPAIPISMRGEMLQAWDEAAATSTVTDAISGGTTNNENVFTSAVLTVDAQGQVEVEAELRDSAERIETLVKDRNVARMASAPRADLVRTAVGFLAIVMPPEVDELPCSG